MAGFLYFIEGLRTCNVESLREYGLADVVGEKYGSTNGAIWPSEQEESLSGRVIRPGGLGAIRSEEIDGCVWECYFDYTAEEHHRRVYVGIPAELPTPEDLRRDRPRAIWTRGVSLADGNVWEVPVAVMWLTSELNGGTHVYPGHAFPGIETMREGQRQVEVREPRLLRILNGVSEVLYSVQREEDDGEGIEPPFDLLVDALGVCYRVGPVEVSVLGLIDSQLHRPAMFDVLADHEQLEGLKKKIMNGGGSSGG